jgi:glycosyltransferase involved in cell wall biosynthesis
VSLRSRIARLRFGERSWYVIMRLTLAFGYFVTRLLVFLAPVIPKPRDRDLAIYLFNPLNSDGHYRRFKVFFPFLERDGIDFELYHVLEDPHAMKTLDGPRTPRYRMFARIYWKRLFQVLKARRFRQVFIQRNLFPNYPDKKFPHLERLCRRLCDDITIDFWDPVYLWDPEVTYGSLDYADRLVCDNSRLLGAFADRFSHERSFTWPIAVDLDKYEEKVDYALQSPVRLLYTGSYIAVRHHLEPLMPILEDLHRDIPITLTVIGIRAPQTAVSFPVHHMTWDKDTYFRRLAESDIALFPFFLEDDELNNLRVAGKTLDYMASGLPFVGSSAGLAEGVDHENVMVAVTSNDPEAWREALTNLINEPALRSRLGSNARAFIATYCPVPTMYERMREILATPVR